MANSNPAFSRNPAFTEKDMDAQQLQELFDRSGTETEAMTVEDSIAKTGLTFAVLIVGAVAGWMLTPSMPALWMIAGLVGLVLAMVNIFKREPSPGLIMAYAAAQGVFIGGISLFYNTQWPGIVVQAVLATFVVIGVTLALFVSGKIRASAKATKIFLILMVSYLVYSLINVLVSAFGGANGNPFGISGEFEVLGIPLGVILGPIVILLGAYSLVLDFDSIQRGVAQRAPKKYGWSAAFGIMVTVIWLYLEILRFLAILRSE